MRKISTVVLLAGLMSNCVAQQFWAPGACWFYSDGPNGERYSYLHDTVVDGMTLQVSLREFCYLDQLGAYQCSTGLNGPFYEYVTLQDEVVLSCDLVSTQWDTLYWLGLPGDRWWAPGSEANCMGFAGMIEVQDTGHVVHDGISLRTWIVARLQEDGTPSPWFTETITERIGSLPRYFCPTICSTWTECETYSLGFLGHYSDVEVSIPDGTYCDFTTAIQNTHMSAPAGAYPNPGTDQLWITGLTTTVSIEVHDPLGRLVHSRSNLSENAPIETASWDSGTYFIAVVQANGVRDLLRWVKQ